jgi:orotidine-5'-phosphate decarboxylase
MPSHFADRLGEAINRRGTPACVGLDPVLDRLPEPIRLAHDDAATAIAAFCSGVIRAVAPIVPAIKIQSACFERFGDHGVRTLRTTVLEARAAGLIVILDAKRGDIGLSAEHYAAAAFEGAAAADALTVSPYLGPDTLEPYLRHRGHGVFVLVRTSNPGSDHVQSCRLQDGRSVAELIADQVAALGRSHVGRTLSSVGAVVAATKPEDAASLRARMPETIFLVPGYGAQGGTAADLRAMLRPSRTGAGDAGILVTASRSVIYPTIPGDAASVQRAVARASAPAWIEAIADAAARFAEELRGVVSDGEGR